MKTQNKVFVSDLTMSGDIGKLPNSLTFIKRYDNAIWNAQRLSLSDINKIAAIPEEDFAELEKLVASRIKIKIK